MDRRYALDGGWSVWLDDTARWRDIALDRLDELPACPPGGGWNALDAGLPIDLPATTLDVDPEHRGVSWWSREVDVTAEGPLVLRFGGVRLLCEVFWDRRRLAVDLEGYTPFEVRVPAVTPGRHRLDLRVTNPGGMHSWDDFRPVEWGRFLLPSSHDFGGPWQPVSVHEAAWPRIADVWVRPDQALRAALVDVTVESASTAPLRIEIVDPAGAIVAQETATVRPGTTRRALPVPDAALYSPGSANLYRCRVTLGEGAGEDTAEQSFGFRLLDYSDGTLRLNGEPLRLATAISWGRYRRGPVPSPGDVEREVESIVAFGQNALSAHRFPSTPELQDALEARGLLLHQEPGGVVAPELLDADNAEQRRLMRQLLERRVRRLARRDRSRACLAWWNIVNEWGNAQMRQWPELVQALPQALRGEDDTRLTTFTSGWGVTPMWRPFDPRQDRSWDHHRVFTWPNAWNRGAEHDVVVAPPPEPMLAIDGESACFTSIGRLREIVASFPEDAKPGSAGWHWRQWLERLEADLQTADPGHRLGGLDGLAAGTAAVQAHGFARLIEAHRRQDWLHGLALNGWHQHHKVGTSGIVAPDRSPVCDPEPIRRANAATALAFSRLPRVLRRGVPYDLAVERLGPGGREDTAAEAALSRDGRTLWQGTLPGRFVPEDTGLLDIEARQGDLCVTDRVLVVDPPAVAGIELAVVDPYDELTAWLEEAGVRARPWRFHEPGPVLVVADHVPALHEHVQEVPRGRVAVLTGRTPHGCIPTTFDVAATAELPSGPRAVVPMHGSWVGGWAFSLSDAELPSLGPAGVWGAERGPLCAARGRLDPPPNPSVRWLTGFCSFPDADLLDIRAPRLAASTWLVERGGDRDMLHTYLPLVERRDHPLGRAVLCDLIRWLSGDRGAEN